MMVELPPRGKPRYDSPLKVKTISNCFKKVGNGDGLDKGMQNELGTVELLKGN